AASMGAIRSTGVERGVGVGVDAGGATVVCVVRVAGAGVGVAVGTDLGAMAELRRGRESCILAAETKLSPTTHVAAKTSAEIKIKRGRLKLPNRSLVRFIINNQKQKPDRKGGLTNYTQSHVSIYQGRP